MKIKNLLPCNLELQDIKPQLRELIIENFKTLYKQDHDLYCALVEYLEEFNNNAPLIEIDHELLARDLEIYTRDYLGHHNTHPLDPSLDELRELGEVYISPNGHYWNNI